MATDTNDRSGFPRWLRIVLIGRNPRFTALRIVVLVLLAFLVRRYALLPVIIRGPSMLPTYQENGVNFVNRLAYRSSEPQRGDVVAIRYSGVSTLLMKRVLALPGETIEFRNGQVFINGNKLEEPYMTTNYPSNWNLPPETVKLRCYYVVGDNRTMPEILHYKGEAERERIVGKILLCKNLFASSSSRR